MLFCTIHQLCLHGALVIGYSNVNAILAYYFCLVAASPMDMVEPLNHENTDRVIGT